MQSPKRCLTLSSCCCATMNECAEEREEREREREMKMNIDSEVHYFNAITPQNAKNDCV
jgi:hypothetical protein